MATSQSKIETPSGPRIGSIFEKLDVLGVGSFLTQTGNQAHGAPQWSEYVDISVPAATLTIVVSLNYWALAYGSLDLALDPLDESVNPQWKGADQHFGVGRVSVSVVDINAPDYSVIPATQTARLGVRMNLLDDNGDDPWFGIAEYMLTYLGHTPRKGTEGTSTVEGVKGRILWR